MPLVGKTPLQLKASLGSKVRGIPLRITQQNRPQFQPPALRRQQLLMVLVDKSLLRQI